MDEEFRLKIHPRMLEVLSQDLYTNIYNVLSELIANAYDADAQNVYVDISEDEIRIEDDGDGMTAREIQDKYLHIGGVSRSSESDSKTNLGRLKMGRKGVGKLSGLSISKSFQVITAKNGELNGLIVPKKIDTEDAILEKVTREDLRFKHIKGDHGTAIVMKYPDIKIPQSQATVMRNLSRIFPANIENFNIIIFYNGHKKELSFDLKDTVSKLGSLITLGSEYAYISEYLEKNENIRQEKRDVITHPVVMKNTLGVSGKYQLTIKGWIGTYRTVRGLTKDIKEFSDNYIAIYAHNKMGARNVLEYVSKNRVYENYIVGNLYIDLFEETELPDMAGTNRQGYNENDPRWGIAMNEIQKLTDEILNKHKEYAKLVEKEKDKQKMERQYAQEESLRKKVKDFRDDVVKKLAERYSNNPQIPEIVKTVENSVSKAMSFLGLKTDVDAHKKKILISQTRGDKDVSDVVYNMLLFNNVPAEDILYSNGDDPETNLPVDYPIYDYLQKFFVRSQSDEMIAVIFVMSEECRKKWGVLMEVGAAWITQREHCIFNINDCPLDKPLNVDKKWVNIQRDGGGSVSKLTMTETAINDFVRYIIKLCETLGYNLKDFDTNKKKLLKDFVEIK